MEATFKNIFRFIAILEGISYILLLISTPIKYFLHNEQYVKALGMPHGILFLLYIALAFSIKNYMHWDNKNLIIIILASIIPFGTFYIDYRYLK
jgi:integral membrane protein